MASLGLGSQVGEVTLGRDPASTVAIDDPVVSARHARIGKNVHPPASLAQIRAEIAAASGQHERALRALSDADALGMFDVSWMHRCPALEPLRGDPTARAGARAAAVVAAYLAPME